MTETLTLDALGRNPDGTYLLLLVEEGPWPVNEVLPQLKRVQGRLFNTLSALLDGQIAEMHPETRGGAICLRLQCYGLPTPEIEAFFEKFTSYVAQSHEYSPSTSSGCVASLKFELRCEA